MSSDNKRCPADNTDGESSAGEETPAIDIAYYHYDAKQYAEAETAALIARDTALAATPPQLAEAIEALDLAAQSAAALTQLARAVGHHHEAAALTDIDRDPLQWGSVQHWLAYFLHDLGHHAKAEECLRQAIPVLEEHDGADNPNTLNCRIFLATVLQAQGKHAEAEEVGRTTLAVQERILGPEHHDVFISCQNLSLCLDDQGETTEALALAKRTLSGFSKSLGEEHHHTIESRRLVAKYLEDLGNYSGAEVLYRANLAAREQVLGSEHPDVFESCMFLAICLDHQDKTREALPFARRAVAGFWELHGLEHPDTQMANQILDFIESRLSTSYF